MAEPIWHPDRLARATDLADLAAEPQIAWVRWPRSEGFCSSLPEERHD